SLADWLVRPDLGLQRECCIAFGGIQSKRDIDLVADVPERFVAAQARAARTQIGKLGRRRNRLSRRTLAPCRRDQFDVDSPLLAYRRALHMARIFQMQVRFGCVTNSEYRGVERERVGAGKRAYDDRLAVSEQDDLALERRQTNDQADVLDIAVEG